MFGPFNPNWLQPPFCLCSGKQPSVCLFVCLSAAQQGLKGRSQTSCPHQALQQKCTEQKQASCWFSKNEISIVFLVLINWTYLTAVAPEVSAGSLISLLQIKSICFHRVNCLQDRRVKAIDTGVFFCLFSSVKRKQQWDKSYLCES